MSDRPIVLVLSNDFSLAAAKTSRQLCLALEKLGMNAICRDTRLVRWGASELDRENPEQREAYEAATVAKWGKFLFDYGVERILSLDLHWLFSARLFLDDAQVRAVHSFWFDDLRSHLQTAAMFPLGDRPLLDLINTPKVMHHCYGSGQLEELRTIGVQHVVPSRLAASSELLQADAPCTQPHRIAFIGNPGLASPPSSAALKAIEKRESLAALRRLACDENLAGLADTASTATWLSKCPQVRDLLAAAMEARLAQPHAAAISLLVAAGTAFPAAFDYLNRHGQILDATLLVKLVNRYDRPALAHRLWKRDCLDVYGLPEQWAPYGIIAQPTVAFPDLATVYRRYPVHLNAANCARDATANEKLFEIAACGRLSLNLDSPDVRACYSDDEAVLVDSADALEAAAQKLLAAPDQAADVGERARARTAREHLWEHRLEKALA